MTTRADVCGYLAAAVAKVGIECKPFPLLKINAPVAQVAWNGFDPRFIMTEAKIASTFIVGVFLNSAIDEDAMRQLTGYAEMAGSGSVIAAVQNESNWPAGVVDNAVVTNVSPPAWVDIAGAQYASCQFTVEVVW